MKRALRALTFRGKALIAVGLGLGAGAALSGQRDVLRIAVLLLALPLISAWLASRTHFRLGAERSISPTHVPVGSTAQATLTVTNLARRRTSTLLLEEHVDPALGAPVFRVLEHVEPDGSRQATYPVEATQRGRYDVGPLSVTAVDPFGLVRLTRSFDSERAGGPTRGEPRRWRGCRPPRPRRSRVIRTERRRGGRHHPARVPPRR